MSTEIKSTALSMALDYARSHPMFADEIVQVATKFEKFLLGKVSGDDFEEEMRRKYFNGAASTLKANVSA